MRKTTLMWLLLAAAASTVLFHTSQKVTDGRQVLSQMNQSIRREEESLRVLQAEWSYLNQPERLEKLAGQYLTLQPQKGRQFTKLKDLKNIDPADLLASKPASTTSDSHPAIAAAADEAPQDASLAPVQTAVEDADTVDGEAITTGDENTTDQLTVESTSPVVITTQKTDSGFRSEMQRPKPAPETTEEAIAAEDLKDAGVTAAPEQAEEAEAPPMPIASALIDLPVTEKKPAAKPKPAPEKAAEKPAAAKAEKPAEKAKDKARDFGDVMKGLKTQ